MERVWIRWTLVGSILLASQGCKLASPRERWNKAEEQLAQAESEQKRFYVLAEAAKSSFEVGEHEKAKQYAGELISLAGKCNRDWNYGNAIHDGNMVLGRLALAEGNPAKAKSYLLEAGKTPGSPQLGSFGPNMSLARDLLLKQEHQVVLEYFDLCKTFWTMGRDKLDDWKAVVASGHSPDFGANLLY